MKARTITPHFRREKQLESPVTRYLRNRDFTLQDLEVPFYEYRMDVYGYSHRSDLTVAVELKMARWGRAVQQALLYQLCSDLVYIAMPKRQTELVDVDVLREYGLGLISVEETRCKEVISAVPSPVVREHYRQACLAILEEGRNNVV